MNSEQRIFDNCGSLDAKQLVSVLGLSRVRIGQILACSYQNPHIPYIFKGKKVFLDVFRVPSRGRGGFTYQVPFSSVGDLLNLREYVDFSKNLCQRQSVFCDWLSISQVHLDSKVPDINGGSILAFHADGSVEWTKHRYLTFLGSFDTSLQVRFDSERNAIELSGNVGAFGEPDNVFGLPFSFCIKKINLLLVNHFKLDFEPFTVGRSFLVDKLKRVVSKFTNVISYAKTSALEWDGAVVTMLHLTLNYSFSTRKLLNQALYYFSLRGYPRLSSTFYSAGVVFGQKSKFFSLKLYDKYLEYLNNSRVKKFINYQSPYHLKLLDYLENFNLLRFELEMKSRYLSRYGLRFLGSITDENLEAHFMDKKSVLLEHCKVNPSDLLERLGMPTFGYYQSWLSGADLSSFCSSSTLRRHARRIRECGLPDITKPLSARYDCVPSDVEFFDVSLKPALVPSFYRSLAVV